MGPFYETRGTKMKFWRETAICTCMLLALPAFGQEEENFEPVPEPPEIPPPLESGTTIEPDITIIRREDTTYEEYRLNGHLYMVKIIPTVGAPYYMLDADGDGNMESRMNSLESDFAVPQWVLFSW